MTVNNDNNRIDHVPDGVLTVFAYDFRVDDADHLVVYEDGVVVADGHTVTGVGDEDGGDVTFDVAPSADISALTFIREVPATQETAYPSFGPFPAASHEAALDKLTFLIQQVREELGRTGRAAVDADPLIDWTFPDYDPGSFWAWDAGERRVVNTTISEAFYRFNWTENTLAALQNREPEAEGEAVYVKGRTSDGDGYQGTFVWSTADLSAEVTADTLHGIYVAPTSDPTGASGAWVRQLDGYVTPEMFGATGDGIADDTAPLVACDSLSKTLGLPLVGRGTYGISTKYTITTFSVDLSAGKIVLLDTFTGTIGVQMGGTPFNNEIIDVVLNVDGNRSMLTGVYGFVARDISTGTNNFKLNLLNCDNGLLVDGNSERLKFNVGGFNCGVLVTQKINYNTPDENDYRISGGLCDTWFLQDDNTSSNVHFNVESNFGSSDWAVKILGSKWCRLSGIIRASYSGGVYCASDAVADDMVHFAGLVVYASYDDYAVYAEQGRTLSGDVIIRTALAGGVFIGNYTGGVDLRITLDNLRGGYGLRLGDDIGSLPFRLGSVKLTSYGNTGTDVGVLVDRVSGSLDLDMISSDHSLRTNNLSGKVRILRSSRLIGGDVEVDIQAQTPAINFIGGTTYQDLAAYSYGHTGMTIDRVTNTDGLVSIDSPGYYNGGNWSNAPFTATAVTTTLPTNGLIYLNASAGAIAATLPNANRLYQRVTLWKSDAANNAVITVTKHETSDPEVFTFDTQYDRLVLEWMGTEWKTVYNNGVTI